MRIVRVNYTDRLFIEANCEQLLQTLGKYEHTKSEADERETVMWSRGKGAAVERACYAHLYCACALKHCTHYYKCNGIRAAIYDCVASQWVNIW